MKFLCARGRGIRVIGVGRVAVHPNPPYPPPLSTEVHDRDVGTWASLKHAAEHTYHIKTGLIHNDT